MKRTPLWFLVTESIIMALVLTSLLSTVTSDRSSLLPDAVTWVVIVLAALALLVILAEIGRRKFRGS
ncbi:hypothetical protein GCM10027174_40470 [Salinifilum aidingensis]